MLPSVPARVQLRRDAGKVGPSQGPWIRARQVGRWLGVPDPGALVQVEGRHGEILGWGLPSERSAIAVRMLAWGAAPPEPDWLTQRLGQALAAREGVGVRLSRTVRPAPMHT